MEFLLVAVVVGGIGIAIVLWRNREPRGPHGGVDGFRRGIQALAPHHRHQRNDDLPPPRHRPPRREDR